MIRTARFGDIPGLVDVLTGMHARSVYAARCGVDIKTVKSLLMQAMQRDGLKALGGTCTYVGEKAGKIEAVFIGTTDRVYHIGDKLMAQDLFFVATPDADPRDAARLLDAYIAWAEAMPDVIEINASVTNILGDEARKRVEKLLRRKGFVDSGSMFERTVG